MKFFSILILGILMLTTSLAAEKSTSHSKRFFDQVVIVTGASRGIGKGIAQEFAKEGAKVVLVGRNESALKRATEELQSEAIYVQADVSCAKDIKTVIQNTLNQYGKIDILCHNAGIYPHAKLETMSLEEWQHVIDVNLTGTFLAVQACIPHMKKQGHGKIVITSSISGPHTALPGYSHYTASKGGVAGFIKTAAVELAKYGININAVEPGNILTEGLEETGQEHIENMIRAIPLGRLGTPEDVAYSILFLASQEASFITGQSIIVDGGQTLPESHFEDY